MSDFDSYPQGHEVQDAQSATPFRRRVAAPPGPVSNSAEGYGTAPQPPHSPYYHSVHYSDPRNELATTAYTAESAPDPSAPHQHQYHQHHQEQQQQHYDYAATHEAPRGAPPPHQSQRLHPQAATLDSYDDGHRPQQHATAPPVSPNAAGKVATATTTDQESFYARILAEGPSIDEVAAHATPAYVRSLMDTISRGKEDVERVLAKVDDMQRMREQHHVHDAQTARAQAAELQVLRQQVAEVTLQLQEERERSTRLLHENTVLYTQEAERKEQLAALIDLAQRRGKALQQQQQQGQTRRRGAAEGSGMAAGAPAPSPLANSLSLRAAAGLGAPRPTPANSFLSTNTSRRELKEESIIKEESSRAEGHSLTLRHLQDTTRSPTNATAMTAGNETTGADDTDADVLAALRPSNNTAAAHILALTEEVQILRQQLDEQRSMYERERGVRVQQEREQHRAALETQDRQAATIRQLEELHECALRDLVAYRHRTDKELRDVRGQVDWLKQSLSEALNVAEAAKRQHHVTATAMTVRAEEHYRPKMRSLMMELTNKRQTTQQVTKAFEEAMAEKDAMIERLQEEVKRERTLRKRAEERRRLEVQGVCSELDLMRQSLRQVEKRTFFTRAREAAAMAEEKDILEFYHPAV